MKYSIILHIYLLRTACYAKYSWRNNRRAAIGRQFQCCYLSRCLFWLMFSVDSGGFHSFSGINKETSNLVICCGICSFRNPYREMERTLKERHCTFAGDVILL